MPLEDDLSQLYTFDEPQAQQPDAQKIKDQAAKIEAAKKAAADMKEAAKKEADKKEAEKKDGEKKPSAPAASKQEQEAAKNEQLIMKTLTKIQPSAVASSQ